MKKYTSVILTGLFLLVGCGSSSKAPIMTNEEFEYFQKHGYVITQNRQSHGLVGDLLGSAVP